MSHISETKRERINQYISRRLMQLKRDLANDRHQALAGYSRHCATIMKVPAASQFVASMASYGFRM